MLAVVVVASLAGCLRPFASGEDPDRESVALPRGEFFGEILAVNGTMRLSLVPGEVAAPVSEEPVNCFVVQDRDEERQSYLGGVSVDLAWDAVSAMTETLNVSVYVGREFGLTYLLASMEGKSPLHFVHVDPLEDDSEPFRTPVRVVVKPAGTGLPVPDQPIAWTAKVGILESAITAIAWRHCEATDLPVLVPLGRVPRTSSIAAA